MRSGECQAVWFIQLTHIEFEAEAAQCRSTRALTPAAPLLHPCCTPAAPLAAPLLPPCSPPAAACCTPAAPLRPLAAPRALPPANHAPPAPALPLQITPSGTSTTAAAP